MKSITFVCTYYFGLNYTTIYSFEIVDLDNEFLNFAMLVGQNCHITYHCYINTIEIATLTYVLALRFDSGTLILQITFSIQHMMVKFTFAHANNKFIAFLFIW